MASPKTKPGTQRLSEVARKVVVPSGITATGWPAVSDTCRLKLGVSFDEWQHGAGRAILAKRANGKLACTIGGVGMSVCRQVGKTYLIGGLTFGLAINRPKMLTIWSAHHGKTHAETFLAMQSFARRLKVAPFIDRVYTGSGDEAVVFRNGSRILFGARERGFGRGIPGVDMIVSDEAQIMSEKARDDQLATMNTSDFGLAIDIGTPPKPDDPSESFTQMRTDAWAGTLQDAVWIEIGAEPGTDPNDRSLWPKWNPSHPHRTPVESILRLQRRLSAESFRREGMGMWDEDSQLAALPGWSLVVDLRTDEEGESLSQISGDVTVTLDVAWDRLGCALAVGGKRAEDGRTHVELVDDGLVPVRDLARRAAEVVRNNHASGVHLAPDSAAGSLIPALEALGVQVHPIKGVEVNQACGAFFDAVADRSVVHIGQKRLDDAVEGAEPKGGQSWRWDRKGDTDISPLYAVTFAHWVASGASGGFNIW